MESDKVPVDNPVVGKDPELNNCFDYEHRNPFRCPFAAHTRKTGPRSDIPPENVEKRLIRRGGTSVPCFTIFALTP